MRILWRLSVNLPRWFSAHAGEGSPCTFPMRPEGCALSAMLGQDAAERLCAVWGGLNVIVPNLRRGGPLKPEILARLERGERPDPLRRICA